MTPAKSRIKPWVWIVLLSLLAGLLVGWLVIGWWLMAGSMDRRSARRSGSC